MQDRVIGVVGAGVMGTGLAQSLAQTGHRVLLIDVAPHQLERSRREIRRGLRLQRLAGGGSPPVDDATALAAIECGTDLGPLRAASLVIENVTEKWSIKRDLYPDLDRVCPPDVVFAVNTSAIPITRVASVTRRPDRVVGSHFMNPVPLKPMVEVIRAFHTSDETLMRIKDLIAAMGKECIVVDDSPGFVTNRVMMLSINEAIFLLHEKVSGSPEDVDRLFKTCFGHKMGPLETADLIGLDTILYSIDVLHQSLCEDKYRPCTLLSKMVDAGLLGRKSGEGFYKYGASATSRTDGGRQ